jgi:hypothetical protein
MILVARIEPPGLAYGEPEDRLCEMREHLQMANSA